MIVEHGFWSNLRRVFGPVLVGLLGSGLFTLAVSAQAMQTILNNCARTYEKYPSLKQPWLALDGSLSAGVLNLAMVLGTSAFLGMGLGTALLARPRDRWDDISAGLATGLAATLASMPIMGWATVLALAVVPSLADLSLLSKATQVTAVTDPAKPSHPTDVLVEPYPDLKEVLENERGEKFFPKIVADQVLGSALGVWTGLMLSLATAGVVAFCGTLAAGYLLRRGDRLIAVLLPYLELSLPLSALICFLFLLPLGLPPGVEGTFSVAWWFSIVFLALLTLFTWVAVPYRWNWHLRAAVYLIYFGVLWVFSKRDLESIYVLTAAGAGLIVMTLITFRRRMFGVGW